MKTISIEMMNEVAGGGLYEDAPVEVILEEARKSAIYMKANGNSFPVALDLISRYYSVPGKIEREEFTSIVEEVYFGEQ